jgi:hypothetical protein
VFAAIARHHAKRALDDSTMIPLEPAVLVLALALATPATAAAELAVAALAGAAPNAPRASSTARASPAVPIADAFRNGDVELSVWVVPGTGDGRSLRIGIKNATRQPLRVAIPAGVTELDVGEPIGTLNVKSATKRTLTIAPGTTAGPVTLAQVGARRAIDGTFSLWVADGKPEFRGEVTTGIVAR